MTTPSAFSDSEKSAPTAPAATSEAQKKDNVFKRLWLKTGLTPVVLILMFKGALAPTIALAAYQADAFASQYTTLGYLVAIMSLISLPIQPRAKFIQSMITSLIFTCVGAAVSLLQIQCAVAARESSTAAGGRDVVGSSGSSQSTQYNASASATAAVWLFVTIYIANIVRAYRPQLMLPTIQYAIFTVVASTYAPSFPNMTAGESFARRLLVTFLTGFAIATGVSLFIFPITSRKMTAGLMAGLAGLVKSIILTHGDYMHSISMSHAGNKSAESAASVEAKKLQKLITETGVLFGKIRLELGFARKEIAWGKWQPHDFSDIFKQFRGILLPGIGLSTFLDIMQKAKEMCDSRADSINSTETLAAFRKLEAEEWDEVIAMAHEPYTQLKKVLVDGLDHICFTLEITTRPKSKKNDEEQSKDPSPGDKNFATKLETELETFHRNRGTAIQRWCTKKGIDMPSTFWQDRQAFAELERSTTVELRRKENQQQLYLVLYFEFLVYSMGKAILDMVKYADSKVTDGTMSKKKFINPGWRRLRKLFYQSFDASDTDNFFSEENNDGTQVFVGDSLKQKKDPEHLPPVTIYQKFTHWIRVIPKTLASPESAFAFRAAVATLSIGVLAYLRQTWLFFLRERGLWALIMVAISMGAHSGQGIFGFAARILGTIVAMVASFVIWYVGYGSSGARIFLFFIYAMCGFWFIIKNPPYVIIGMISTVTGVLIVGYELQADKIGTALAASNGQPYYPIYLLGPYRLAAVIVGLAVAFIWTYFPYPVTTHSTWRKDLGNTLYLLANHYSCVHTTINAKMRSQYRSPSKPDSAMARLDKARLKVFQKCVLMIGKLREHAGFTKFEPTFGGKFPQEKYDALTDSISRIFQYLNLIAYSADTFASASEEESDWMRDFRRFASETKITSHETTSILCLVSASILNAQPLPPYLRVPKPYALAEKIRAIDPGILSLQHVAEPCYAAFAVLEVASTLLTEEITLVIKNVQGLVGEVDFSFHVISTSSADSSTIWEEEDKGKKD